MTDKFDEAISRALGEKGRRARRQESAELQETDLWRKIRQEVERGVNRIYRGEDSKRLAGGELKYEPIDANHFLSESEFSVKNITLPGHRLTVRNCGKYLSIEMVLRRPIKANADEEEIGSEEMHFGIDENDYVFLSSKDKRSCTRPTT